MHTTRTYLAQFLVLSVALTLALGANYLYAAWSGPPSGTPPTCPAGYAGCDAPVNVGATTQTKTGDLTVSGLSTNALSVFGNQVVTGKLGVGATSVPLNQIDLTGGSGSSEGIRFADNTVQKTAATGGGGIPIFRQYTANATWTKPAGLAYAEVYTTGGGGGGGGGGTSSGGGGGAGGTSIGIFPASSLSASYSIVVGAGGTGGAHHLNGTGNTGSVGGNSRFGTLVYGNGGSGGVGGGNSLGTGGAGGTASGGSLNIAGGKGVRGSAGGSSFWGGGHDVFTDASGVYNSGGGGGDGGYGGNAATIYGGTKGSSGVVVVKEYY